MGHASCLEPDAKRARYADILGGVPDAIFILAGGMKVRARAGGPPRLTSTGYSETEKAEQLICGGKARVIAAAEVARTVREVTLVPTSTDPDDPESNARLVARELQHYGVSPERLVLEERSRSTLTEMIELVRLTNARGWRKVVVLTNDFHIPRAREMFDRLETLCNPSDETLLAALAHVRANVAVRFVAAEEIMPYRSDHYRTVIEAVHRSLGYQKRLQAEQRGIEDLRAGRYGQR